MYDMIGPAYKLSVVIVTYNSENDIFDCLKSVYGYSDIPAAELEVIVVDNNSLRCDDTFSRIHSSYPDVKLLRNERNGGYGQGNNIGIRYASAPVILIMNPDVRLMEPVFATALQAFEKDSGLCMYGMKQMFSESRASMRSFSFTNMMNGYLWVMLTAVCNRMEWFIPRYQYIQGSCFFVRKSAMEAVGMFDESFFLYGEEDDLHYRIVAEYGPAIIYNPKLRFIHLVEERSPDLEYEKKLLDVAIRRHELKGYPRKRTLRNYLRRANVRLLREYIRKRVRHDEDGFAVLSAFRDHIRTELSALS